MSGIRIKNLQSASPLVGQSFDEMLFVVDLQTPDTTLCLSGAELRSVLGIQAHTHSLEDIDGLIGELEKKLDKAGGTISGDLRVLGEARFKSLEIGEYLSTPELRYNRITATGNELWATDAGVVDEVYEDSDGVFLVTLKGGDDGEPTVNFQYKDILRGIFKVSPKSENGAESQTESDSDGSANSGTSDSATADKDKSSISENSTDSSYGFATAYFEVTGVVDERRFDCVPLGGMAPQRFMTLVRQGNKADERRQGSVYMDGLRKYLRVLDGVKDHTITQRNIKAQLGDLSNIDHPVFGRLEGFGAYLENAYICGRLVQRNPESGEDFALGAVAVSGEQVFHHDSDGVCDKDCITLTAKEMGITSTPEQRKWQCKSGAEWVDIDNEHSLTLTIPPDASYWTGRTSLTVRYIVQDTYFDLITITKLHDGEDAYRVEISSSSGDNFINGDIGTTLSARVYKGSREITDSIAPSLFSWTRTSADPTGDAVWNALHEGCGGSVALSDADIFRKAVFECEVRLDALLPNGGG